MVDGGASGELYTEEYSDEILRPIVCKRFYNYLTLCMYCMCPGVCCRRFEFDASQAYLVKR